MPESVSLAEVVSDGVAAATTELRTATIAVVDSYDLNTERAKLVSCVRSPLLTADGEPVYEDFPVFSEVPVAWPRGAASGLSGALAPGDSVLLVFLELGIGEWRVSGGTQNAVDVRRHSDGYPVALAGIFPDANPLAGKTPDAWELGYFGGATGRITVTSSSILLGHTATDFVALTTKTDAAIKAIQEKLDSFIANYTTHQHAYTATPGNTTALPPGVGSQAGVSAVGAQPTVASTMVKAL